MLDVRIKLNFCLLLAHRTREAEHRMGPAQEACTLEMLQAIVALRTCNFDHHHDIR